MNSSDARELLTIHSEDPRVQVRITGLTQSDTPGRLLIEVELTHLADSPDEQLPAHSAQGKPVAAHPHKRSDVAARTGRLKSQ